MFVTAETLAKDDLVIIRTHGNRAVQPEYEDMYFVVHPPYDYDDRRVAISLISMWADSDAITTLFTYRYELVEIGRL